jgi:ribosomal protein S18 acetylase RimI-like enzyme
MPAPPDQAKIEIRPFAAPDEDAVVALWETVGLTRPWNDPHRDIARKLQVRPEWLLVAEAAGEVVGTVMAGYDGHRGWINYLAVSPTRRRSGLGRALMAATERILAEAGCPKVNLQLRSGNDEALAFYEALGYGRDDVVSLGKRLEHDLPTSTQRE